MFKKIVGMIVVIFSNEGENYGAKEEYGIWDDRKVYP